MNCEVKYYHVESQLNIADKGTREDCSLEYLSSKEWQNGPAFIQNLENSPATLKLVLNDVYEAPEGSPVEIHTISAIESEEDQWESLLTRNKNLKTVLRAVALIKKIANQKSFKVSPHYTQREIKEAFLFLIMKTQQGMKAMKTKQLVTFTDEGIISTQLRFPEHVRKSVFGNNFQLN